MQSHSVVVDGLFVVSIAFDAATDALSDETAGVHIIIMAKTQIKQEHAGTLLSIVKCLKKFVVERGKIVTFVDD